ncbi:hypothetical protein M427DRAFT_57921 [Gonapodya prolifera JEL478]|uniref:F-box domain-containing protein n=1 Tax=Gonapodya prolifera (strain JEL478) TaxID=1344416 RepID=A0A139ABI1_GONPJ|nr:hypothetical protein M427DRAFT_57921 [Gonapodya prolifera JEL478]|eukprot:KXS14156.1 hypothetical protein M427DRAFT_57921 [Gonapodya prolifera JEL478]
MASSSLRVYKSRRTLRDRSLANAADLLTPTRSSLLESLPIEVLHHIFQLLPPKPSTQCFYACRAT